MIHSFVAKLHLQLADSTELQELTLFSSFYNKKKKKKLNKNNILQEWEGPHMSAIW